MHRTILILGLLAALPVQAEIAVSANDGKQPHLGEPARDIRPDTVAVIELGRGAPRVIGTVVVPVSMIGPPTSIAMPRKGGYAIVSASQKSDPADPTKFVPDDIVSVIDLADPAHPRVSQTLHAGAGATGIAINRAGTLALVASTGEGTISIFSIAGKTLAPVGKLQLDAKPGPVDVAISPDGRTALVTQRYGTGIWRLAIDGTQVRDTGIFYATGGQPYGVVFSNDGRFAYNSNLLGRPGPPGAPPPGPGGPPRIGTVTAIDLVANTVVTTVDVGPTPEHVALSPDGKYLEVTVVNGSSANSNAPNYRPFGLLQVYKVAGASLIKIAEARTGQWGQGAAWSADGRTILLQGAIDKVIDVYHFNGRELVQDTRETIHFDTRPGAIVTARSR